MPISTNEYLEAYSDDQILNAEFIMEYFTEEGWSRNAISAMLGNMQRESTINFGVWQNLDEGNLDGGYGIVQWTPASKFLDWCDDAGLNYRSPRAQCERILYELENDLQWIETSSYPETFEEFTTSTKDVEYLTMCFLKNYERAGVAAADERIEHATFWVEYFGGEQKSYTPRLTSDGIRGSYYWYAGSPFYNAGYGLPNCTCYAWGRFWEISDPDGIHENRPTLATSDAGRWFEFDDGYERGYEPKLGAVACFSDTLGGPGHVSIVEEILENGDIVVSQSAYGGAFFSTRTISVENGYSYGILEFKGFIYNPYAGNTIEDVEPVEIPKKKKRYNFIVLNRRKRIYG